MNLRATHVLVLTFSILLAGCFGTSGGKDFSLSGLVEPFRTSPTKPAPSRAVTPIERARAGLYDQCLAESGDLFRREQTRKVCECYAGALSKSMNAEELEYFASYERMPTLNRSDPSETKKKCGGASPAPTASWWKL